MRDLIVWLSTGNNSINTLGFVCICIWLLGYAVRTVRDAWKGED